MAAGWPIKGRSPPNPPGRQNAAVRFAKRKCLESLRLHSGVTNGEAGQDRDAGVPMAAKGNSDGNRLTDAPQCRKLSAHRLALPYTQAPPRA